MTTSTQTENSTRSPGRGTQGNANKFLTFCLGREEYGLEILVVREIIGMVDITPLPRTPDYVKGVINLRGKIIPVIELRAKFALPSVAYTQETCVIVVEAAAGTNGTTSQVGVIVDSVREVLDIDKSCIEPAPNFGSQIPLSFILGMGKVKDKVVTLLDIENIQSVDELITLAAPAIATGGKA